MTIVGDEEREMLDEDKVIGAGNSREGLNVVQDNEININTTNSDRIDVGGNTLQAQGGLKLQQQQQSQGSAVCWEQFLHVTSIKVLLVENDDSTRHVVSALLRNCNYEVIEAANGLQAWKILENLTYHIDLVLTEVVMPCLSGLGLLCKIMSHYARKTIPVIMMSSHDSMGLVFKCLSKGAVDFLVKPIRKNELKNLWQHVWRRCHSSSGSGSESGTQTQKSIKSKSSEKSENNSGSNDGEDNGSDDQDVGSGSDDGSGTQSSWTKQAVEVDSSLAVPPRNLLPECSDSTCAQVLHSNAKTASNRNAHINTKRKCQEAEEKPDCIAKRKSSLVGIPRNQKSQSENAIQIPFKLVGAKQKSLLEIDSNASSFKIDKHRANLDGNRPSTEYHDVTAETSNPRSDSRELNKAVLEINNASINESKQPLFELSLKRLRGPKEPGKTAQDDRNVLRRSDLSAFSRYNSSSNPTRTPHGITLSSSLIDNSQEVAKKESVCDIPTQTNEKLHPTSNGTGNNIDMGSTTNKLPKELLSSRDQSEATSTINNLQPSSAFKPVKIDFGISPQQGQQVKPCNMQATTSLAPQGSHTDSLIQQPHQHHRYHHVNDLDQHCTSNHVDCSLKKLAVGGPNCASSNILARPHEGNPEYQSLNRSASGSNRGSNAQDGSCTAINAGRRNGESDNGLAGKNGSGDASGSGCGSTIDPSKLARAAALTKFHHQKKERCFKKKGNGL
ncbi:PREDICTED: two-component response regulator-like APRR7 isoform X2 [Nicotiana attenuata]|uniref:Two-component response regulator-like aprr7 n=1 Tax=Nicotiana attenuata TaxID=49451 RepID=A0A1J6ISC7_NICAT|nr:PREDICTED: two-component response regulator-like APRR7 isoform X2 [Nicotiana attenuata]OIS98048.1 two-component response regulator-like aprr7 [Nicotiana attenuata]